MGKTTFAAACRDGDISKVMEMLDSRDPAVHPDQEQLHEGLRKACWASRPSVVDLLLLRGAHVTDIAVLGACNRANAATFQAFLDHGWDVNSKASGHLALRLCVDSEECTRLLLANGADPNLPGDDNIRPLESAAMASFSTVPELLISHGAVLEPDYLYIALDPFARGGLPMVKYFLEKGIDPNLASRRWGTPLHHVVERNETEKIPLLLKAGADPHLKAADGRHKGVSPIELAESLGKIEMQKLLLGRLD